VLRELFEIEVFRFLRKRELLSRERMEPILSWPHSGFNVHVGEAVAPEDRISLTRVARYMLRASVVMSRISYDRDHATVRIDPRDPHSEGPIELDVLDFIARLSVHIPEPHERLMHNSRPLLKRLQTAQGAKRQTRDICMPGRSLRRR